MVEQPIYKYGIAALKVLLFGLIAEISLPADARDFCFQAAFHSDRYRFRMRNWWYCNNCQARTGWSATVSNRTSRRAYQLRSIEAEMILLKALA